MQLLEQQQTGTVTFSDAWVYGHTPDERDAKAILRPLSEGEQAILTQFFLSSRYPNLPASKREEQVAADLLRYRILEKKGVSEAIPEMICVAWLGRDCIPYEEEATTLYLRRG
jgi:hypothetical protein